MLQKKKGAKKMYCVFLDNIHTPPTEGSQA